MRWSVWARVALSVVALSVALTSATAGEEAYKPELPLVQVKVVKEKTTVLKPGQEKPLDKEAVRDLLAKLAAYTNEDSGWKGKDDRGISLNPLVVHVDAMAEYDQVIDLIWAAAGKAIYRIVLGIPEQTETPLKGAKAPDLEKLDAGYLHIDLPIDDGFDSAPRLPKESITLSIVWDSEKNTGSYSVDLGGRALKPVGDSQIAASDLKSKDATKRNAVRDRIKNAINDCITQAGGKVDKLKLKTNDKDGDACAPWALVDLAYRSCKAVNDERVEKKESKFDILLPVKGQRTETPPDDGPPDPPPPDGDGG